MYGVMCRGGEDLEWNREGVFVSKYCGKEHPVVWLSHWVGEHCLFFQRTQGGVPSSTLPGITVTRDLVPSLHLS